MDVKFILKCFCTQKAIAKFQTSWLQSCFTFFLIWPKVPSYKKSQVYIFLDDLKMALWDRKVSNTFKKQTPDQTWIWSVAFCEGRKSGELQENSQSKARTTSNITLIYGTMLARPESNLGYIGIPANFCSVKWMRFFVSTEREFQEIYKWPLKISEKFRKTSKHHRRFPDDFRR